jgi:hypothetical protein
MNCRPLFGEILTPAEEKFAFVLMPFEKNLEEIYDSVIKPTVKSKDLKCRRADDYKTNKAIMIDIWKAICQSQVVIAEMTGLNPNVMYELGISHTIGKETIMMTQRKRHKQEFPFDISHIRRIEYRNVMSDYPRLKAELSDTLDFVLQQVAKESPVSEEIEEDREEQLEDLLHSVTVNSQKEVKGLSLTVHGVNFYDDRTEVFLEIKNETKQEVSLYPTSCYAVQGKKQARGRYPWKINTQIPPGIVDEGWLSFHPIDPTKGDVIFYFDFSYGLIIGIEVHIK